jgi:hypothetical protein
MHITKDSVAYSVNSCGYFNCAGFTTANIAINTYVGAYTNSVTGGLGINSCDKQLVLPCCTN